MKKFLVAIALTICVAAIGQTEKGRMSVGGNISLDYLSAKSNHFSTDINPEFGIFVDDNLYLGFAWGNSFRVGIRQEDGYSDIDLESRIFSTGIGPKLAYYYPLSEQLYAYSMVSGSVNYLKSTFEYLQFDDVKGKNTYKTNTYKLGAGIGLAFFFSENTSINCELAYAFQKEFISEQQPIASNNEEILGNQIKFNVGFTIYL
ncbi:MAG TPA: hypothetical protein DDX98_09740 [Bacteroidales bacterium]|nr:hypothetical protein [Bacteroidales bacterium]